MSLLPGSRLGPYEITAKLGEGGMGVVFRANDVRLGREVALKVLAERFSRDPERLARFEREAKVLAQLNHPNIAQVHGLEVEGEIRALVMELVDGPTLADRLAAGPLPLDDCVEIARQIAAALEAAHEKGIVHRDLKPENVKAPVGGTVKVLDFGLAKALGGASSGSDAGSGARGAADSPTITSAAPADRGWMGTAAYMSPEQAKRSPVDGRADLWAFGVVLFEMLSGRRPFAAPSTAETLAKVLGGEIDWTLLPTGTPPALRRLIRRCLERNPHDRLHHAGDARIELDELLAPPEAAEVGGAPPPRRQRWPLAAAALGGAVLALAVAALAGWPRAGGDLGRSAAGTTPRRAELAGIAVVQQSNVAVSPDGREVVAYDAASPRPQLVRRSLDAFELRPIPGTEDGFNPFFAPDGHSVGFFRQEQLCVVALDGSGRRCLAEATGFATGSWGADGTIVFSSRATEGGEPGGLWRTTSGGGAAVRLTTVDAAAGERLHTYPQILPDGRHVLFTVQSTRPSVVAAVPLAGGPPRQLIAGAVRGRYLASGHLAYFDDATARLAAVPFDLGALAPRGSPVFFEILLATSGDAVPAFEVSENGTLVYSTGTQSADDLTVERIDRHGVLTALVAERGSWAHPRVSPDGRRILLRRAARPDCSIWLLDVGRGALQRVALDGDNHTPLWLGDGAHFLASRQTAERRDRHAVRARLDGDAAPEPVAPVDFPAVAESVSADGRFVALSRDGHRGRNDVFVFDADLGRTTALLAADYDEDLPAFSPDGRLLAYVADDTGRTEVYVRSFPGPGARHLISTRGGLGPVWSRDGRELFYAEGTRMMRVEISTSPRFSASEPSVLFDRPEIVWERSRNYDVLADGTGFVVVRRGPASPPTASLRVVFDWFGELAAPAP